MSFVRTDTSTQGSWKATYGADGYDVAGDSQSLPGYAQMSLSGQSIHLWEGSTGDVRATQKAVGSDRLAACWYSFTSFDMHLNLTDGATHQVALYALDWDSYGPRNQTIEVLDAASGAVLDRRTLTGFAGGQYVVWNVKGHVKFRVKNNNSNAVISGVFFGGGGGGGTTATASFVRTDTNTQGSWRGSYGADGYHVVGDSQSLPGYARLNVSEESYHEWAGSTGEVRAMQRAAGPDRIAACWYSSARFNVDVNLTDGLTHQVALYALDWDSWGGGRNQTIEVLDAGSGAVLDTRTVTGFASGQYLVWNVKGRVVFRVTNNNSNAVISGVFFGGQL